MKKIIVFILAFLYLGVSSGIAMEIHYCMGEQAGVEYYGSKTDRCGKCGMKEKKGGCCNSEEKFLKVSDAHQQSYQEAYEHLIFVTSLLTPIAFYLPSNANEANFTCTIPPPPDINLASYCNFICVFRI